MHLPFQRLFVVFGNQILTITNDYETLPLLSPLDEIGNLCVSIDAHEGSRRKNTEVLSHGRRFTDQQTGDPFLQVCC